MQIYRVIFFFAFVVFAGTGALSERHSALPDWEDGYVVANGIRIHYWRTGGAKPQLVMVHGYSDDGLCWANLAKELEGSYDIILPDARGHGLSDPPSASDPADVQVEDLAGLIRELELGDPVLMGHSMGSASVAWFAAKYPEIPRAIVLEDPGLIRRPRVVAGPEEEEARARRRAQILQRNNLTVDQLVGMCMTKTPKWGLSECKFWAPSKRRYHPDTTLRRIGDRPPMIEVFPKITKPTLILKAEAEGEVRKQNEEVAGLLRDGRIVHIEGAGHNVRRDQKQRVLEVLGAFLDEVE